MTLPTRRFDPKSVNCGRRFGEHCNAAYDLLGKLEPGLCVDVGAAIGRATRRILNASPASRVVAYEPFGGNHPYFSQVVGDDPRVALKPVAVADRAGRETFVVPGVVRVGSEGWAKDLLGYSSLGHLGSGAGAQATVDVVTLDDEIHEHVRFLKIDVQGGEMRVLNGASRLMKGPGIDMIYVEFNGALGILKDLRAHGYVVFDCAYMAWPTRRYVRNWLRRRPDRLVPGWEIIDGAVTSTGLKVAHLWPRVPLRRFAPYCAWFFANRLLRTGLQTDLLCVHRRFLPALWDAIAG